VTRKNPCYGWRTTSRFKKKEVKSYRGEGDGWKKRKMRDGEKDTRLSNGETLTDARDRLQVPGCGETGWNEDEEIKTRWGSYRTSSKSGKNGRHGWLKTHCTGNGAGSNLCQQSTLDAKTQDQSLKISLQHMTEKGKGVGGAPPQWKFGARKKAMVKAKVTRAMTRGKGKLLIQRPGKKKSNGFWANGWRIGKGLEITANDAA